MLFVAGNQSAEQDPALALGDVLQQATQREIIVNAIYCGSEHDAIAPTWQRIADMTQGTFASINQAADLVAQIETPLDAFAQGQPLSEVDRASLPEPMQNMPLEEVEKVVVAQSRARAELKQEIAELDAQRRDYVDEYCSKEGASGLDAALVDALTKQAEQQWFVMAKP